MEADLQIYCTTDYRDRWAQPPRRLTLRRIKVLLDHLPPESALGSLYRDGKPHWSLEAHLLDDLRLSMTGSKKHPPKPHPSRPSPKPKRLNRRRIADGQRRRAERLRQIEAGELT